MLYYQGMRCLSIRQPWAGLIASGRKSLELRSWTTDYRGPLVVLAGSRPWQGDHGHEIGPLGVALCVTELVGVRPLVATDAERACITPAQAVEWASKEWFAWELRDAHPVTRRPVKGRLGLYRADADLVRALGL